MKTIIFLLVMFGINTTNIQAQVYYAEKLEICEWDSIQNIWINCTYSVGNNVITLDKQNKIWSINDGVSPLVVSYENYEAVNNMENTLKYSCFFNVDVYYNKNNVIVVLEGNDQLFYRITYYIHS